MKNKISKKITKPSKKTSEIKPYTTKRWLIYMLMPTLLMLVLTVLVLKGSMYTKEESIVGYNEVGNIDYKVYLKENNYYQEQYLGKNMQYIASIIKDINTTFTYEMHSEEQMEYTYTYKVSADLIISDPNDNNKVLYKRPSVLVKDTKEQVTSSSFRVDKDVVINYDEYNNYVNAFKKEYALTINSKLVLTFNIDIVGKSSVLKEDYNKTSKLVIAIPLSEQTINIGIDTSDLDNSGTLEKNYMSQIKKPVALVLGIIVGILSLALLYIVIYNFLTNRPKVDIYKSTVRNILREYDRAIVSSKTADTIDESKYNVIQVPRIEELLDAHDSTGKPILYSENSSKDVSTFIIVSDEMLYKYSIVKRKLEEAERKRIEAKNKALNEQLEKFAFISKLFKKEEKKPISEELNEMLKKDNDENKKEVNEEKESTKIEETIEQENEKITPNEEETIEKVEENLPIPEIVNLDEFDISDEKIKTLEDINFEEPKASVAELIITKDSFNELFNSNKEEAVNTKKNKKYNKYKNNSYYKNKKNYKNNSKKKNNKDEII